MYSGTIAFLSGILVLQQMPALPNLWWGLLLIVLLPLAAARAPLRVPAMAVSGFLWAALRAGWVLSTGLDPAMEGKDVVVEGRIASVPQSVESGLRFEFAIDRLSADGADATVFPERARLTWYQKAPPVRAGETWQLKIRLKQPRGFLNPGGFDYEGWLFQRAIRATGYVRDAPDNRRVAPASLLDVNAMRQRLGEAIRAAVGDGTNAGILVALAIGESRGIDAHQWDLLTGSGTNHLVAISGLHIALVAGAAFLGVRRAWVWAGRAALHRPAPKAAAVAAILAATGYAALAGFSIPTQRSLVMVIAAMSGLLSQRASPPGRTLALALLLVLVFDPVSVLAVGFWLSFGAVAVILLSVTGRVATGGIWWKWGRLQWLVAVGLTPALLLFFQTVPLVSPLANLIAIPWVSFVVTPLTLLGTAVVVPLPAFGALLLQLADLATSPLWPVLEWMVNLPYAQWTQHAPVPWAVAAAVLGIGLLLTPQGFPARGVGAVFVLPALVIQPTQPTYGTVWFTLLDVGQGLAAVVRTQNHTLLYDTGPRFRALDTGEAVVVPFLRHSGVRVVDTLIVSHPDNDHGGGAEAVLAQVSARKILTSEPDRLKGLPGTPERCAEGQSWRWDGVEFRVLNPPPSGSYERNDRACVLRVSSGEFSLLLTGDIEAPAEQRLVNEYAAALASRVLVVPHHGSKTSSTASFLQTVRPEYALVSAGYRNPFGFPHPAVSARYEALGAQVPNTATAGAITLRFDPAGGMQPVQRYRENARRYWNSP